MSHGFPNRPQLPEQKRWCLRGDLVHKGRNGATLLRQRGAMGRDLQAEARHEEQREPREHFLGGEAVEHVREDAGTNVLKGIPPPKNWELVEYSWV